MVPVALDGAEVAPVHPPRDLLTDPGALLAGDPEVDAGPHTRIDDLPDRLREARVAAL
jgi:hypothetical protein